MQDDLVKMGVKVSSPQKHQKRMITLQKSPQQARLHLHDEPTEFDMLLLNTWAEPAVKKIRTHIYRLDEKIQTRFAKAFSVSLKMLSDLVSGVHTAVVWSGFITHSSNICPHASSLHSPDGKRIFYYCELWWKTQYLSSDRKIQSNTMHTVLSRRFSQVPRDSVSSDSHLLMSVSYLTASRHCITRKHSHSDWFPPETSRLVFALSTWQLRRGNSLIQGKEFAVWHKVWQSHVSRPSLLGVCVNHCPHKQDKGRVVPDGPLLCI